MKIGIDIGGSHIATGLVGDKGKMIGKESRDISIFTNDTAKMAKEKTIEKTADMFEEKAIEKTIDILEEKAIETKIIEIIEEEISILINKYDYKVKDIEYIGISAPGNPTSRAIRNVVNLNIKEFTIADILEDKYNIPVSVKNDGKCAGLAEKKYGALKGYKDCVFLCIGTGVGSAVFLNGKLLVPSRAPGFEFGHTIIGDNGIKCKCGRIGCFETYASMKRFKNTIINELGFDKNIPSEEIQEYVRKAVNSSNLVDDDSTIMSNDESKSSWTENIMLYDENAIKAIDLVDSYLDNVAIGISNIINIFEPEAICFGGSFAYYEDIFLPILSKKLNVFNKDLESKLLPAKLKNDAGIVGATC